MGRKKAKKSKSHEIVAMTGRQGKKLGRMRAAQQNFLLGENEGRGLKRGGKETAKTAL